ncbi:MAG: RluA family pseudouridine synthase [Ignavibacteriales bacterium]
MEERGRAEILNVEQDSLLLDYLLTHLKNKSKNNIKSILSRGSVFVDNKPITKFDYKLRKGQIIEIRQILKNYKNTISIIYEDNDLVVVDKPDGLLSIATDKESTNTAYHLVREHIRIRNPKGHIFVVHRLDRDTSGILVFAKNEKIKNMLQDNWNDIVTIRGYVAIVEGQFDKANGTIKSWLKENKAKMVYSSNRPHDGDLAITHYQVLRTNDKYSLVDIRLDTGRKNQIRVHMKDLGHSVIGDKKYGSKSDPLKRLGLHANVLEFKHPISKKVMHFEVPIPDSFNKLVK